MSEDLDHHHKQWLDEQSPRRGKTDFVMVRE
jgi:hypothetical protein